MTVPISSATRARLEAHLTYAKMLADAKARGPAFRRALEAHLGRTDLFYLMVYLLRRPDIDHDWLFARCREVEKARDGYLDLWAREHGKMQRLDEPTPTPDGWKAHGDLVPGDWVFGANGLPTRVVAIGPVHTNLLGDCTHALAGQTVPIADWPYARGECGGVIDWRVASDGR